MPTQTEREDLGTNARQTAISTLITEGEPAVKAATDLSLVFFSVPKHSRLKEKYTTEQNRRARDVFCFFLLLPELNVREERRMTSAALLV